MDQRRDSCEPHFSTNLHVTNPGGQLKDVTVLVCVCLPHGVSTVLQLGPHLLKGVHSLPLVVQIQVYRVQLLQEDLRGLLTLPIVSGLQHSLLLIQPQLQL